MSGAQPKAAPGQVWRWPTGQIFTVAKVNSECIGKHECAFWEHYTPWMGTPTSDMTAALGWSCIGISAPAGRVMVGERRQSLVGRVYVVVRVCDGKDVEMHGEGVVSSIVGPASDIASWPLLPPVPPQGETEATWSPTISRDKAPVDWSWGPVDPKMLETVRSVVAEYAAKHMGARIAPTLPEYGCDISRYLKPGVDPSEPIAKPVSCGSLSWDPATVDARRHEMGFGPLPKLTEEEVRRLADTLRIMWAPKANPRAEREQRRREIDAVLREDARRFPAFATARRAAVMATYESAPPMPPEEMLPVGHAENILRDCHRYEAKRGGMTKPSADAVKWAALAGGTYEVALAVYERARSLP